MEGGWIPVVRAKGRSGTWRSRMSSGVFTVFVDNLPASLDPKGMFNLFMTFGVIKDVFIPKKRRRATNTRFGFVMFECLEAARVAVQKANGLWVDDRPLQVKHAEFGKVKAVHKAARTLPSAPGRREIPQATGEGVGKDGPKGFRDQRSYVQAVAGERAKGLGGIYLKAEEFGNGWLLESVVIRLKAQYADVNLKKELEGIGIEDIMVRESGGRDVVITFRSKEERTLKLPPMKELILEWCEDIVDGESG
ncbi:serine/arginine-rich splicing factor 2-like [Camellia sinensis]|uniref:serine/arginine-rich splicing factor 2-like n=1 Tax=Camellia sinensis TaxID=4442 RepID=UPI0010362EBD|nr:serine/arginine-rich splicing factor 2-like [Camellia sinensis]